MPGPTTYTAAAARKMGGPLELIDVPVPALRPCELLVRTTMAGLCRSDLVAINLPMKAPRTVGHEILGVVARRGEDVPAALDGAEVVVYPWVGCGGCPPCEQGQGNACEGGPKRRWIGFEAGGGFAEYVLVPHYSYAVSVQGIAPELACTLPCSGLTAYGAVSRLLPHIRPGHHLLVFGAGGVGLMVLQMARALTAATVICVDVDEPRLALAREFGAHHAFLGSDPELVPKLKRVTGGPGVEFCIDTVNHPETMQAVLTPAVLRNRGRLVVVGLAPGSVVPLMSTLLPILSWSIEGFTTGTLPELRAVVTLAREGRLRSTVTRRYSLQQAPQAVQDLKDNRILGRAVITFDLASKL